MQIPSMMPIVDLAINIVCLLSPYWISKREADYVEYFGILYQYVDGKKTMDHYVDVPGTIMMTMITVAAIIRIAVGLVTKDIGIDTIFAGLSLSMELVIVVMYWAVVQSIDQVYVRLGRTYYVYMSLFIVHAWVTLLGIYYYVDDGATIVVNLDSIGKYD